MVFPYYFKIGCMYWSKSFLFERYLSGVYSGPLPMLLYQLPYVLKQPRTKKYKKSCQPVEATLHMSHVTACEPKVEMVQYTCNQHVTTIID